MGCVAETMMQQRMDGMLKNLETLKSIKAALGG